MGTITPGQYSFRRPLIGKIALKAGIDTYKITQAVHVGVYPLDVCIGIGCVYLCIYRIQLPVVQCGLVCYKLAGIIVAFMLARYLRHGKSTCRSRRSGCLTVLRAVCMRLRTNSRPDVFIGFVFIGFKKKCGY